MANQRSYLTFSRQFLSGLHDRDVAKAIIEREPAVAHNVEALRKAAITIEERRNYYRQSNYMNKALSGGQPPPVILLRLQAVLTASQWN